MRKYIAALLIGLPLAAVAESSTPPTETAPQATKPTPPWGGEAELGVTNTTGNSETSSLNGKARLQYQKGRWTHTAALEALKATDHGTTTAQSYTFNGKSKYNFHARNYVFGNLQYQDDHFSGYRYQASETAGYGRRVIDQPRLFLDLEAGAGARQSQPDTGTREDEAIGRVFGNLEWKLGKESAFSQSVTVESGSSNTQTQSVTALKSHINGNLAMKVSYTLKHNSRVPVGTQKTDTITTAALVLDF